MQSADEILLCSGGKRQPYSLQPAFKCVSAGSTPFKSKAEISPIISDTHRYNIFDNYRVFNFYENTT